MSSKQPLYPYENIYEYCFVLFFKKVLTNEKYYGIIIYALGHKLQTRRDTEVVITERS